MLYKKKDIPTTVRNNSILGFAREKQKVSHGLISFRQGK